MNSPSPWASALPDVIDEAFPHSRTGTRRTLAATAGVRRFGAGHAILRQGDESSVALVLEGHVAARRTTDDGRQLIVRIIRRGGLASLLPLIDRPLAADIVALTPSPAALWRADEVRSLATADPGLAVDVLDNVLSSFEEVVKRLDGLLHQNALRRVARVLSVYGDLFFAEPPILTRAHLPILVGTSREMTGRVLRVLESRHIVARVGRDRLRLLDAAGLEATAEPEAGADELRSAGGTSSSSAAGTE
jgi:CRP-like cAMP-binding protein